MPIRRHNKEHLLAADPPQEGFREAPNSRVGCVAPQLPGKYEVRAEDLGRLRRFRRADDGRRGSICCVPTISGPQSRRSTDVSRRAARKRPARLVSLPAGMAAFLLAGRCGCVFHYYYYFTKPILRVKGGAWRCAGREAHKCALLASSCRPSKAVFVSRLELRLPVSMV